MDDQPKSAEEIRAEILKRRENAEAALTAAIAQKRAEDFTAAADLLAEPANDYVEVEPTKASIATLVVFRRPTKSECSRYRTMANKDSDGARQSARIDLAQQIVIWPDAAGYSAVVADCPFVPDRVAVKAIKLAEGEARSEAKK